MAELIQCPSCNATLRVPESSAGREVKCPKCSRQFRAGAVPAPTAPPPPAAEVAIARPEALPTPLPASDEGYTAPAPRQRRYMGDDDEDDHSYDRERVTEVPTFAGPGRAWLAITMLINVLGVEAVGIAVNLVYLQELKPSRPGDAFDLTGMNVQKVETLENILTGLGALQFLAYLTSVVTFSIWIYAAYRNLHALRVRGLQYSPG